MTTTELSLILLGDPHKVHLRELGAGISPYTAKPLKRYTFELTVRDDQRHDALHNELSAGQQDDGGLTDSDGGRWRVRNYSYRYVSHQTDICTYTIEIEEHEELQLEAIRIGDITLKPDKWTLKCGSDRRDVLQFLTTATPEQNAALEEFMEEHERAEDESNYFPVELVGVREATTRMRFGRCTWRQLDDSSVKHHVVLVSENGDNDLRVGLCEPEISRLIEKASSTALKLDRLIEVLQTAKILDAKALRHISDATPGFADYREFDRHERLEEFFG